MILAPLQKLPNNVGHLGKIILITIFKWFPKVQKIAQSGHIDHQTAKLEDLAMAPFKDHQKKKKNI